MKQKKGFSLVELLIVIGIIAVLGGVMLTQFSGSTDSALAASCLNNMRTLCNAALADASKQSDYPSAGPFRYLDAYTQKRKWAQGWIGYLGTDDSCNPVSCYHAAGDEGLDQYSSITNGTIWRRMGGKISAYVCPAHTKMSKKGNRPTPSWTYVMNSYFGWDNGLSRDYDSGKRTYGGMLTFRYSTSGSEERKRAPEKVLLFAELPYAENGIQSPEWATSADTENDMILQYAAEGNEQEKANRAAEGSGEAIGFNHKSGNDYSAHVAFADGHCEKLMMPREGSEDDLVKLTTWLCTGQEYTFNGAKYEKVSK